MKLYIDPGTGSMLFTILIGLFSSALFFGKKLLLKLQFLLHGGAGVERAASRNRIPFVIFSDHKRYWNVFEPVCDEFERRGIAAQYWTASPDDEALTKPYTHVRTRFIGEGNAAFARLNTMRAAVVLSTTPGLDVYQWKRAGRDSFYVHCLHAANDATAYRMFGLDYYDAVLLSGAYQIRQIRALEQMRRLPAKELCLTGLTYMDAMRQRLLDAGEESHEGLNVLLAPTWGKSGILSVYGASMIRALLASGVHLIIRPHPQSFTAERELIDALREEFPESERVEWNGDADNFSVLHRSDILISDYSGIIFDFALVFDKPVIYADTSFDNSPYDAWWLEEEMWTFSVLPEIGHALKKEDLPRIGEVIEDCMRDTSFAAARKRAREETWAYPGEAAQRTVDYLTDKYEALFADASPQDPARAVQPS